MAHITGTGAILADSATLRAPSPGTRFTPLEDFYSEALRSHYLRGFTYTVREGNDTLAEALTAWLAEGKVRTI